MASMMLLNLWLISSVGVSWAARSSLDASLLSEDEDTSKGSGSDKGTQAHIHEHNATGENYCKQMAPSLKGASDCWQYCSYKDIYCRTKGEKLMVDKDCAKASCSTSMFGTAFGADSVGEKYCRMLAPHLLGDRSDTCWGHTSYNIDLCYKKGELLKVDKWCGQDSSAGEQYCKMLAPHLLGDSSEVCWERTSYRVALCSKKAELLKVDKWCAKDSTAGEQYCLALAPHLLGDSSHSCWDRSSYQKALCAAKAEQGIFDKWCS